MNSKYKKALNELIKNISSGEEFPDAVSKISIKYNIDCQVLTDLYDQWCLQKY